MTNYYVDFVGLNTFLYEPVGFDVFPFAGIENQNKINGRRTTERKQANVPAFRYAVYVAQNLIGSHAVNESLVPFGLQFTKNASFSFKGLPTTASFFPALMLRRNGPYGYPMWKQTRVSENPLTRRQNKESIFTIIQEPGPEFSFTRNNMIRTQRSRYGNILKFDEVAVTSKFNPVRVYGSISTPDGLRRVSLKSSLGNSIVQFNNPQLNEELARVNLKGKSYEELKKLYLDGALFGQTSPFDIFEIATYSETVYPPQVYTYKYYTRQRTEFVFPWRDSRQNRRFPSNSTQEAQNAPNGFGSGPRASVWVMDAPSAFDTAEIHSSPTDKKASHSGFVQNRTSNNGEADSGILQNNYSFAANNLSTTSSFSDLDLILRPAPIYNRKHMITPLASVNNRNGMRIEGVTFGSLFADIAENQLPCGEAAWDAGKHSKLNPFYDSYNDFIEGARQIGKDHTIIPEFRISDHVAFYETNSPTEEKLDIFEITGGLVDTTGSNQENFFKIYTNSDFMKNFEMVVNDNKELGVPLKITLNCKGIKKLLPYDGFYPQQRTVQLAEQFFNSYSSSLALATPSVAFGAEVPAQIGFQNALTPMYAPGIMFNSIKSGVAVDYPLITKNLTLDGTTNGKVLRLANDNHFCSFSASANINGTSSFNINADGLIFDRRLPFETLIQPENLQGIELFCNEPDALANVSSSATLNSSVGDRLYTLMAHNFLAETPNFFLQRKAYTTFYSKPSNRLLHFEPGFDYMMRVKMYKTTDDAQVSNVSGGIGDKFFTAPQYSTGSRENFTMYSRPSAFGPPSLMSSSNVIYSASQGNVVFGASTILDPNNALFVGNRPDKGENYPFTPPYYHGQAWADIKFSPTTGGAYTVKQIINSSSVQYYRYVHPDTDTGENIFDVPAGGSKVGSDAYIQNNFYNKNALQLSASVNIFSVERDETGALNEETARWVIQSKWESPMLNFNAYSDSNIVTLPTNGSQSVPRGMWHQWGLLEDDQSKGIFLQIEDIDPNWTTNILGKDVDNIKSLAEVLDFSTKPKRLGEVANEKTVREAVVAVPFIEEEGQRKFFYISRPDITSALVSTLASSIENIQSNRTGNSIISMVQKMQRYVFPPNMDFLSNQSIDPFAMYIFEFEHTFSKQDLANMWQGLYPKITQECQTATSQVSHPLLAHELLGGGANFVEGSGGDILNTTDRGTPFPSKIRWMVFKVKQRAASNYWRSIVGTDSDKLEEVPQITYNWPYDYFSLVELAKIDTTVSIGKFQPNSDLNLVEPQGRMPPNTALAPDVGYIPNSAPGDMRVNNDPPYNPEEDGPIDATANTLPPPQASQYVGAGFRDIAFAGGLANLGGAGNIGRGRAVDILGVDLGVGAGSQFDLRAGGGFFPAGNRQQINNLFNQGFNMVSLASNFNRNYFGGNY